MTPLCTTPPVSRPRERLAGSGTSLSLEEIIAAIIGSGTSLAPLHIVSTELAARVRSGARSMQQFQEVQGVGVAKAAALAAALSLSGTIERESPLLLTSSQRIYDACSDLLSHDREHLVAFFLNIRNQVLDRHVISIGTLTASIVHPREVFRAAIQHGAAAIAIAHNHPSGDPTPSVADVQITKQLVHAGNIIGIEVVDHIVCGRPTFVSLRSKYPEVFR